MRICVATGEYRLTGETFVNRHIAWLFGGAACVLAARDHGNHDGSRPVLAYRPAPAPGPPGQLSQGWHRAVNQWRHATPRPPAGAMRRQVEAFLGRHGVEAILAEFGHQGLALAPVAQAMGLPLFVYFRGSDASRDLGRHRVPEAYRRMMPKLAGCFAVAQCLLDGLEAAGVRPTAPRVLPSGADLTQFRPGEKVRGACVSLGRFVEKKAPDLTLRAFAALSDQPDARLAMIGDGPMLDPCRRLASELGVADRVAFTGALPPSEVRAHLARAQVFLQHSVTAPNGNTEGQPTAIQEALASGCAVVSTRHAGIPEAVEDGRHGALVAEHDLDGYARALRRTLARPDLTTVAAACRARAEDRFDAARLRAAVEDTIRERSAIWHQALASGRQSRAP
ncbi:glycosyltransferase [Roseisalinus antarcticus]|uniref:GDP-mannose-dependent alpha-(1-6)-phosphatidylinositol monomannoside mannosyltransferase n=1 Tax=Roseisalinus antarcticus TaxID=254357 RepID=A0A1Y5RHC7_9RHOB|nr:glycosyltransferase [Roseisalinus antarcticus]SLN17476.1 GDP-mannose-dependent alpha-(1-6)-phosphatidylinositol monomannoside mannosyltransferase [Roseisalinus antarcticus]